MTSERRCYVLLCDVRSAFGTALGPSGEAVLVADRLGFCVASMELPRPPQPEPTTTQLAEFAFDHLSSVGSEAIRQIVLQGFWIPILQRQCEPGEPEHSEIGWDGAVVEATSEHLELAHSCFLKSLLHWHAIGILSSQARTAYENGELRRANSLRGDLARAALLLDPRVGAFWEYEYACLDEIRRTWRTSETEQLADQLLRALEFLTTVEQSKRQQKILTVVAILSAASAIPVIVEFEASPIGLAPKIALRAVVSASVIVVIGLIWWRLRRET